MKMITVIICILAAIKEIMIEEQVILVNENDEPIGTMPKMEAHEKGLLHRAFSIFIFNDKNELMLQQRAADKYHSPLLWTNTCCSHQRVGETNIEAGRRRLKEEMGFVTELKDVVSFIYKAPFDNGLTEHEYDHVLVGYYNDNPNLNKEEVESFKWMTLQEVKEDIKQQPELYTAWFKIIFDKFYTHLQKVAI
jgi:isopentenyl-diphosphate delta-isomerase